MVRAASRSLHSNNHFDELRPTTNFSHSLVSDQFHLEWLERLYMRLKSLAYQGVDLGPIRPRLNKPLPPFRSPQSRLRGVLMLESTVVNDEGVSPSTLSHSLINSSND
ncbi:hypothetical protein V6N13_111510 [Hibiscus sabdariffa]|uniref:Uncharacterized protein n=1 Tax=Hibiscus sabdariffa TaxID=183260 RepID=A0ABR2TL92_9ROSI